MTFIDSNSISRIERYSLTLIQLVQCGCQKTLIGAELCVLIILRTSIFDLFPFRHSSGFNGTNAKKLVHLSSTYNQRNLNQHREKMPPFNGFSCSSEHFFGLSSSERLEQSRLHQNYEFSLKMKTCHNNLEEKLGHPPFPKPQLW